MRVCVASCSFHCSAGTRFGRLPVVMKISRGTANVIFGMGLVMLFFWLTRAYTWYANDLQEDPYLALIHLPIVIISLTIGAYLTYLGRRARRATRRIN